MNMNKVKVITSLMEIINMVFMKDNRSGGVSNVNILEQEDIDALNLATKFSTNLDEKKNWKCSWIDNFRIM